MECFFPKEVYCCELRCSLHVWLQEIPTYFAIDVQFYKWQGSRRIVFQLYLKTSMAKLSTTERIDGVVVATTWKIQRIVILVEQFWMMKAKEIFHDWGKCSVEGNVLNKNGVELIGSTFSNITPTRKWAYLKAIAFLGIILEIEIVSSKNWELFAKKNENSSS